MRVSRVKSYSWRETKKIVDVDLLEIESLVVEMNTKWIVLGIMVREDLHDE